jgi:hypothetical protein
VWDAFIAALCGLGTGTLREGLVKDAQGNDALLAPPQSEEELVEYEGMLVTGAVAQRR